MSVMRCVNIDWLEVYALEAADLYPCNADYFRSKGYVVTERDYGTRVYREMFTIDDAHGQPFIEVRRAPFSQVGMDKGLFPKESCHLRLNNYACYANNPIDDLRNFMALHNYQLIKIHRIDICLDFVRFDTGDEPAKFVERYMSGKYSKINQTNITSHGVDYWSGRVWNSLAWGKPKSMVSTKMYCKTMELNTTKDKPYIKYAWFLAGLVDDWTNCTKRSADGKIYKPDIWRVEFSIKSEARKWFKIEPAYGKKRKIEMPNTLSMYDTKEKLLTMFFSLSRHYFAFKYYEEGVRKDRCRDKRLFNFSPKDTFYKIDRNASHVSNTTLEQRLINQLQHYYQGHPFPQIGKAVNTLIDDIKRTNLAQMTAHHVDPLRVRAMQLLIRYRLDGYCQGDPMQELHEIEEKLRQNDELF